MNTTVHTRRGRLLMLLLALMALVALTLPRALGLTWASPEEPDHQLTYRQWDLKWDKNTGIDPDGTARLTLFKAHYDNVDSAAGKVFAPGTAGHNTVRLKNTVWGPIQYTAVLYRISAESTVPVAPGLSSVDSKTGQDILKDTTKYTLPESIKDAKVIRAVSGQVAGNSQVDLDVDWLWQYYVDAAQDAADTAHGNQENLENVTLGLYIVVEDNNSYGGNHYEEVIAPRTGDGFALNLYLVVMIAALAGIAAVAAVFWRQRKHRT